MPVTDYFTKYSNGSQPIPTTLSAQKLAGASTASLTTATGWDTTTVKRVRVYSTTVSGSQTVPDQSTICIYDATLSGTTLSNLTLVWSASGSDQTHAAGATVDLSLTASYADDLTTGLLAAGLNQDGTQTPVVKTSINDVNGNEVIKTPATTSAVNEITVTNSATGVSPRISATGGDTNIDLYLSAKGTGSSRFAGIFDGWVAADETLTYASSTTFTCSATLAANLSTGDKLKLSQTTVKYFYVVSVSGTTVTVTGGTDYTLANAAITLPFYSKDTSPTGFPEYFAYTPTITSASGSFTSVSASSRFKLIGKTLVSQGSIVITTNGTAASAIFMTIPLTSQSANRMAGCGRGNVVSGIMQQIHIPADATKAQIGTATGTYGGASGETIIFEITYEVA